MAKKIKYTQLNVLALGLSMGLIASVGLLIISILAIAVGWGGNSLLLLSDWYVGYNLTLGGVVIGMIWGFLDGFVAGVVIAWIYNAFSTILKN